MPWKKGESGNPNGSPPGQKLMARAIAEAALAVDKTTKKQKIAMIAEVAVNAAMAGESWAVQFVADRLDGKARQETELNVTDKREAVDWSRDELVRLIDARSSGGFTPEGRRLKQIN